MLAFLAMMLATLAALNQYQAQLHTYDAMIRSEYEIMANAVTIEEMELIDVGMDWDDLEDVDGDTMSVTFSAGDFDIDFQLIFAVQYVDDQGTPSGSPTDYKEVEIEASHATYSIPMVTHTRIFTD